MTLAFRAADLRDPEERQFVIATWSSSFKKAFAAGLIATEDWPAVMHPQLGKILDRAGSRAVIACDTEDSTFFYGWIAGDTSECMPVIYYCYVKEPYRKAGYARQLFAAFDVDPSQPFTMACQTPTSIALRDKIPRARWNPLEVRYPKDSRRTRT